MSGVTKVPWWIEGMLPLLKANSRVLLKTKPPHSTSVKSECLLTTQKVLPFTKVMLLICLILMLDFLTNSFFPKSRVNKISSDYNTTITKIFSKGSIQLVSTLTILSSNCSLVDCSTSRSLPGSIENRVISELETIKQNLLWIWNKRKSLLSGWVLPD